MNVSHYMSASRRRDGTPEAPKASMSGELDKAEPVRRLRWQCRRGMLELDLVLSRFLELRYGTLGKEQRAAFEEMLTLEDQVIHEWIMGRATPDGAEMRALVRKIRETGG